MILGEIKRYLRDNSSLRISRSIKDLAYHALLVKEELTNVLEQYEEGEVTIEEYTDTVMELNYKLQKSFSKSPLVALYKKELKRYFSSYNYVLKTGFGAIMLTIGIVSLLFLGNEKPLQT